MFMYFDRNNGHYGVTGIEVVALTMGVDRSVLAKAKPGEYFYHKTMVYVAGAVGVKIEELEERGTQLKIPA